MSAGEVAEAEELRGWRRGGGDHAAQAGADDGGQRLGHAVCRLADGDDQRAREGAEIVEIFADFDVVAVVLQLAAKGAGYAALRQSMIEDTAHAVAHLAVERVGGRVRW